MTAPVTQFYHYQLAAMESEIFNRIEQMNYDLLNKQRAMTFDEQRDYAQTMQLLLRQVAKIPFDEDQRRRF